MFDVEKFREALLIKPCPFCGAEPEIGPKDPEKEGNAFGIVRCVNRKCPAMPRVRDGIEIADERGTEAYVLRAVIRWNGRAGQ